MNGDPKMASQHDQTTIPLRRAAFQPAGGDSASSGGVNTGAVNSGDVNSSAPGTPTGSPQADAGMSAPTLRRRRLFSGDNPRSASHPRPSKPPRAPMSARLGLRRYLLHTMGISGVLIVVMLAFGISYFVYQTESQGWKDRQNEAARNAAGTVDLFLHVIRNYMSLAARMDADYLQYRPETMHTLLEMAPELQEMVRLDPKGQLIASAYQEEPVISNLFTFPQSNWFRAASAGEPYFSEIQISATNEPYVLMAIPAPGGGVVAIRLKMTVLWNVVSDIRFGSAGLAYIINGEGQIIAHPDAEVVLNHTSISDQPEFRAILQAPNNRWHGMYTNFNGVESVGSSAAIPRTSWIIVTEVPRDEAFNTTMRAFVVLNSAVLAAGLLTILLVMRLVRHVIIEPVEILRAGAERIGSGDLNHRITEIQENEIGQVGAAFNVMAARLLDREAALEQARDDALEASRFKSRLLANVGHDLRTPINAILGYAEIMAEGVYGMLNDQQRRANDRVLSNARRLLNLINSLLDQAQIEAGKLVLRPAAYNPRDLLIAVRETMEIPAQSRGLTLTTESDPELPSLLIGDQQRTQQMIMNLVENALKFTHKGGVDVRVFRDGINGWAIAVRDSGPGIPADAQGFIFEPFRQVDSSPTREQRGVGLGLAIVRQLALLMGGDITLNSEMGSGSTFTIRLPLVVPVEEAEKV